MQFEGITKGHPDFGKSLFDLRLGANDRKDLMMTETILKEEWD